jgi:hypothetical protein
MSPEHPCLTRRAPVRANVGLFGIGLAAYWPRFSPRASDGSIRKKCLRPDRPGATMGPELVVCLVAETHRCCGPCADPGTCGPSLNRCVARPHRVDRLGSMGTNGIRDGHGDRRDSGHSDPAARREERHATKPDRFTSVPGLRGSTHPFWSLLRGLREPDLKNTGRRTVMRSEPQVRHLISPRHGVDHLGGLLSGCSCLRRGSRRSA